MSVIAPFLVPEMNVIRASSTFWPLPSWVGSILTAYRFFQSETRSVLSRLPFSVYVTLEMIEP